MMGNDGGFLMVKCANCLHAVIEDHNKGCVGQGIYKHRDPKHNKTCTCRKPAPGGSNCRPQSGYRHNNSRQCRHNKHPFCAFVEYHCTPSSGAGCYLEPDVEKLLKKSKESQKTLEAFA
jgi:hypothetical protein